MSAQGSRSGLAYAVETVYGTSPTLTPPTTNLKYIPFETHTLDLKKAIVESNDIRPDRMQRHLRHGTKDPQGDVVFNMRKTDFDPFLESVMLGAFVTNILKSGTVQKFFTIEDAARDISQFRLFKGMTVTKMSFSCAPDQPVRGTMSFVGRDMTQAATSYVPAATPDDDSDNEPFDAFNGIIQEGGSAIAYVTALDFTIENGQQNVKVIGTPLAYEAEYGYSRVTGQITARYVDAVLSNKFINETPSSLSIEMDDRTNANSYTFFFPNIKYTGAPIPVSGPEGRLITMPFVALLDETTSTNLQITRTNP